MSCNSRFATRDKQLTKYHWLSNNILSKMSELKVHVKLLARYFNFELKFFRWRLLH